MSKFIQAKLTDEEYRKVKVVIALNGISMQEFIKEAVLDKVKAERKGSGNDKR